MNHKAQNFSGRSYFYNTWDIQKKKKKHKKLLIDKISDTISLETSEQLSSFEKKTGIKTK